MLMPFAGSILTIVALIFLAAPSAVNCDWPPLHKAAYEGDISTAKALISSGALLNQKDFKWVLCYFHCQSAASSKLALVMRGQ
jgi:hypothetical protein